MAGALDADLDAVFAALGNPVRVRPGCVPGDISPDGTLFEYARSTGPSAFDVQVAQSPGL